MGVVFLVGAGPGDPELITVKGLQSIRESDVIVYDRLTSPLLLKHANASAELINAGKRPGFQAMTQEEINATLIDRAQKGLTVCRLKGGDPLIFGRGGEEALALTKVGIGWELVPGVTSALAGPAFIGVPPTHRGIASSCTIITGNDSATLDWAALTNMPGTLLFMMAFANLQDIADKLMQYGKPPTVPAAVVQWATTPQQRSVATTLDNVVIATRNKNLSAPAVFIVGESARFAETLGWFEKRPLHGKTVVITRARTQQSKLALMLAKHGAQPIELPTIKIAPPEDSAGLDNAIANIGHYDWITFVSPNAVVHFTKQMHAAGIDARALANTQIAAVGPATVATVAKELGIKADLCPTTFTAAEVAATFVDKRIRPKRVLHPRSAIGQNTLPNALRELGAQVDVVTAYQNQFEPDSEHLAHTIYSGESTPDYTLFTSSSGVYNLCKLLGEEAAIKINKTVVICMGPQTSQASAEMGIITRACPLQQTLQGLVAEVLRDAHASAPTIE